MITGVRAEVQEAAYRFEPHERPTFPGSPYAPKQTDARRFGYFCIALLTGVTSNFVNSLVTVNLPSLAGSMGLYAVEIAWLPAVYVAFNATANLTLIRARAQFGIPEVTHGLLVAYACAVVFQMVLPSFAASLAIRALCGVSMAALTTLTLYNLIQVFPGPSRPLAFLIGISIPQLGGALARLVPVEALAIGQWRGLHLIELGLILAVLAATTALPIPQSDRSKAFERLDAVTVGLLVPASLLVCGVLSVGRYVWWTDAPWLGWSLVAAAPLFAGAIMVEHLRARPLIQTRWIGSGEMLRFALVAVLVRIALAEQTYGSVGLLTFSGLLNDQLHLLFGLVALSMALGIAVAAAITRPERILHVVMVAALIIAAGAWLDTDVSNLTRPSQLYVSQALIGFGTTLFVGPSLLLGFSRVMQRGADHLVTFIVLFSTTQNIGGLAGSALLGSLQVVAVRRHATDLEQRLSVADPIVQDRLKSASSALAATVGDPAQRGAQGASQLGQAVTREANILAFADVFGFVAMLALAVALLLAIIIAVRALQAKGPSR